MGREATITPEQVHAVADGIKAEGGKPTLRAVRERLGTGSMGTIVKLLQQWRASQERQAVAELALPPALQRALLDFMSVELAKARAPLEAELAEQQQAVADLGIENERQAETIVEQGEALSALAAEKAAIDGKAEQLRADLVVAKEEVARERMALDTTRTELAKATLRLESVPRLESDLAAVRSELATERQERAQAEQRAAVLAAQKVDLDGRVSDGRNEQATLREQLNRALERAEHQSDARLTIQTAAQARIEDLAAELEQARREAAIATAELAALRRELALKQKKPASRRAPSSKA